MKIQRIAVENFLGLGRVDIAFGPITVIAGDNWSGKSSLQQALRLALSGQVERVSLKGDYNLLVREGAKKAVIDVHVIPQPDDVAVQLSAILHATKAKNSSAGLVPVCQEPVLIALLNQHRFSELMDKEQRRELVFQVGSVATDKAEVERRLLQADVPPALVEEVGPLLRQGFDGAADYADTKLKQLRAEWKGLTGEVYGSTKAETWKASVPQPRFAESSQVALEIPKREESLKLAEQQEVEQKRVVERLESFAMPTVEKCKQCDRMVAVVDEDAQDAREGLPRNRDSLAMLQRAVASRKAAVDHAKTCKEWIAVADGECQARTDAAMLAHGAIAAWQKLADLIAWDGIPSELAGKVTKAVNDRLIETAAVTKWPTVQLRDDMEITVGGRLWGLCSEAERWTADAALCEALAWVSGHKILVLDRMDVLQPFRRSDLFDWLEKIAAEGVQSIVFATLKQKPNIPGVTAYWLENGEAS